MNQTELMIAIGGALFAAFLLGWLAGWLAMRAGAGTDMGSAPGARAAAADVPAPLPAGNKPPDDMAAQLADARDTAFRAQDELRLAQIEIEELRSYIDRKLAQSGRSSTGGADG